MCTHVINYSQGTTKSCYYIFIDKFSSYSFVQDSIGWDSPHFFKCSNVVIIYFAPILLVLLQNGSIKFISRISNGNIEFKKRSGIRFSEEINLIFDRYHISRLHFDNMGTILGAIILLVIFSLLSYLLDNVHQHILCEINI